MQRRSHGPQCACLALAVLLCVAAGPGCVTRSRHAAPTLNGDLHRLTQQMDVLPPFPEPAPASGSLWTEGGPGAALVRDTRAYRINDLLTIRLFESSQGTNASTTDLSRSSEAGMSAPTLFGLENPSRGAGQFNLAELLNLESSSEFAGDGKTSRSTRLTGTLTVRVMRVLPNGDLIVAGQKTVMVNRERQILTLVGSVRPVDLDANNQVPSSAVGDLTVRLWGVGEVDQTARQGWFMRMMHRIWPF